MTPYRIRKIFETFEAASPHPETELRYRSHYELLVAVLLSAQATDVSVNKATRHLFRVANTPTKMVALGVAGVRDFIKSIGLYQTKAKHVVALSQLLLDHHQGQVPRTREALESLPGVGRKTANVVLNVAFGEPTMAVDTHIFRVSNRIGLAPGRTPRIVEEGLLSAVPRRYLAHAHHWLILHGRYICKARRPLCAACPIRRWCEYPDKESA